MTAADGPVTIALDDPAGHGRLELPLAGITADEVRGAVALVDMGLTDAEPVRRLVQAIMSALDPLLEGWGPADEEALLRLLKGGGWYGG